MTDKNKPASNVKMLSPSGEQPNRIDPALRGVVRDAIGLSLKAHFDDIANTPIPDKFMVLLAELEAKEARSES